MLVVKPSSQRDFVLKRGQRPAENLDQLINRYPTLFQNKNFFDLEIHFLPLFPLGLCFASWAAIPSFGSTYLPALNLDA
jgi:hypothetical protein